MSGSPKKPGPDPESLRAEGVDWEDAMRHALNKPKPEKGWEKNKGDDKGKPAKPKGD